MVARPELEVAVRWIVLGCLPATIVLTGSFPKAASPSACNEYMIKIIALFTTC